jgi:hypothetical protein
VPRGQRDGSLRRVLSIPSHSISPRPILISFTHLRLGLPSGLNHWVMHPVARVSTNIYRNLRTQQMSVLVLLCTSYSKKKLKPHGLSPRANYTGRAAAACRLSHCQLLRIKVPRGQRDGSLRPYSRFSSQKPLLFYQVAPQLYSRG